MKYLLTLSLIIINLLASAQTESQSNKTIADIFEQKFNNEDYDGIFGLFNADMQKALPIDKNEAFLSQLKNEAGKITQREFVGYERGTYATYKTNFERALYALQVSVDDNGKINGLFVRPYTDNSVPKPKRNSVKLALPFKGEWTVTWGGDTKELNYHVESVAQKNAFDILITDAQGSSHRGTGEHNEDYYAFGQNIYAPCDGEVVLVVDGVKDNRPGVLNPIFVPGNTVIIKIADYQYAVFAHFKQHSIRVMQGQQVKRGQLLGLCGNTGNSSEPHLHFHLQNMEDMNAATGVKCYFDEIEVNGELKSDYSPVKQDKINNP